MKTLEEALRDFSAAEVDELWRENNNSLRDEVFQNEDFRSLVETCLADLSWPLTPDQRNDLIAGYAAMFLAGVSVGSDMEKAEM